MNSEGASAFGPITIMGLCFEADYGQLNIVAGFFQII